MQSIFFYFKSSEKCGEQHTSYQVVQSSKVSISLSEYSYSIIRGAYFFSSGILARSSPGSLSYQLFASIHHYNRLKECYENIYERYNMPFHYQAFLEFIEKLSHHNNESKHDVLQVLIFLFGSNISTDTEPIYPNTLLGNAHSLLFYVSVIAAKPDWCLEKGINIITFPFHRQHPNIKLASYIGGILGNNLLTSLSFISIWEYLSLYKGKIPSSININYIMTIQAKQLQTYNEMSIKEQKIYKQIALSILSKSSPPPNGTLLLSKKLHIDINYILDLGTYNQFCSIYPESIVHEVVFQTDTNQPVFILEGATFSILAVRNNHLYMIPSKSELNHNTLCSTNISIVKMIANNIDIPTIETAITYDDFFNFDCVIALSGSRIYHPKKGIQFQIIAYCNGKKVSKTHWKNISILKKIKEEMTKLLFNP